jgi:uroporphyrinogen-III synthase
MPRTPTFDSARPRVALFRAREDAVGSAARLRRLGFAVARLPVFDVAPLRFMPRRLRYDAVIATSAKAFLEDAPIDRSSPLFVVGVATARAAAQRGYRVAAPPAPDSARLAALLTRAISPGAAVLYLAGRDRKPAIETALAGTASLEVVEAYVAEPRPRWRPREIRALGSCATALHYSRRSAALAAELADAAGAGARFRRMTHVCLSEDAAKPLRDFGATDVRTAARPEEAALFATLTEAAAVFSSHSPSRI